MLLSMHISKLNWIEIIIFIIIIIVIIIIIIIIFIVINFLVIIWLLSFKKVHIIRILKKEGLRGIFGDNIKMHFKNINVKSYGMILRICLEQGSLRISWVYALEYLRYYWSKNDYHTIRSFCSLYSYHCLLLPFKLWLLLWVLGISAAMPKAYENRHVLLSVALRV
jgi:hypothetical protein